MGTHPIFESDFDCLTEIGKGYPQVGPMSSLQLVENEEPGIAEIHDLCVSNFGDNNGSDDGYHSQPSSDTPPSPTDETSPPFEDMEGSNFESGDEDPCDEFKYDDEHAIADITKGIAFVLVHKNSKDKIPSDSMRKIVQTVKDLTEMMRNDMESHFQKFEEDLEKGIKFGKTTLGETPNGRGVYLEKAHDQLIKKVVGDSPSWRAFANVINCTNLVLSVAYKLEKQNQLESHRIKELNNKIQDQLVKIVVEKFEDFIKDMGGFIDIVDYFNQVKKNRDRENETTSTGSSFFSRTAMFAGAITIGAMLFSKH